MRKAAKMSDIYDGAFRTILNDCRKLVIPVINEIFGESYTGDEKIEFFNLLVKLGFKEIEVGFPSASKIEYDFLRRLIDENYIPDDVIVIGEVRLDRRS